MARKKAEGTVRDVPGRIEVHADNGATKIEYPVQYRAGGSRMGLAGSTEPTLKDARKERARRLGVAYSSKQIEIRILRVKKHTWISTDVVSC